MRPRRLVIFVALILAGLTPPKALARSDTPGQETQELRRQLQEMREQMNKMQTRLDRLESAKVAPSASQPAAAAAVTPALQDGTIRTIKPLPQGPTSEQV